MSVTTTCWLVVIYIDGGVRVHDAIMLIADRAGHVGCQAGRCRHGNNSD